MIYQGMFAVITPALITGAFAERMFSALSSSSLSSGRPSFTTRWPTGSGEEGGWLRDLGALDFAGGTVVYI